MRKYTITPIALLIAGVPMPVLAQDVPLEPPPAEPEMGSEPSSVMTPDQKADYDGWTPGQRADFDLWPRDMQAYYWSLPEPRQNLFWKLNANDRVALTAMSEEDRAEVWTMVEQRVQDIEAMEPAGPNKDPEGM